MWPPCPSGAHHRNAFAGSRCYRTKTRASGIVRGFFFFVIGVLVGIVLLVLLPLFIAVLGAALAIGLVIALPLIAAVLILIGIVALAPGLGYGLAIAALLIALWSSDRRRRQMNWRGRLDRRP